MGDIGTERREVEFEPLPDQPVREPVRPTGPTRTPEPAPTPRAPSSP